MDAPLVGSRSILLQYLSNGEIRLRNAAHVVRFSLPPKDVPEMNESQFYNAPKTRQLYDQKRYFLGEKDALVEGDEFLPTLYEGNVQFHTPLPTPDYEEIVQDCEDLTLLPTDPQPTHNQSVEPPTNDGDQSILDLGNPAILEQVDPLMGDISSFTPQDIEPQDEFHPVPTFTPNDNKCSSLPQQQVFDKLILQPMNQIPSLFTGCGQLPSQEPETSHFSAFDKTDAGYFEDEPKSVHFGTTQVKLFDKNQELPPND